MIEMAQKIESVKKHQKTTKELAAINKALKTEIKSDKYIHVRPQKGGVVNHEMDIITPDFTSLDTSLSTDKKRKPSSIFMKKFDELQGPGCKV